MEVVKRKIPLETITHVSLRYSWKEDKVDEAVYMLCENIEIITVFLTSDRWKSAN